jgi:putative peptide zinc metalloprotease protein
MIAFDLVLPDRTRVPVLGAVTLGRAAQSTVCLDDPSVSRRHAVLEATADAVVLQDMGSRFGTWVDGERVSAPATLGDGSVVRVGDQELVLERRRDEHESRRTFVVPVGLSQALPRADAARGPRLRSGYALKRLAASEGDERWVLQDLRADRFVRLGGEGELLPLLDGRRDVGELLAESQALLGAAGPARLVSLLAELTDRGLLAGEEDAGDKATTEVPARAKGLFATREWAWPGAGAFFAALYARGGKLLFTPTALGALALLAVSGLAAFAYLVAGRYGTPFVVASHVGIGGAVFIVGRLAVAALHESAHGLTMAAFGRRVGRAGLKLVLIFPYAFVDTSQAWFLSRRRRIAVSAAGPASDAAVGGLFAWVCLLLGAGAIRDICFQLAFGAYVGALVNLNPFVERDGYHVLADVLRIPGLRRRARAELQRRLSRDGAGTRSPVLTRYALAGLAWSAVAAGAAVAMSLRYAPMLKAIVPAPAAWALLSCVWAAAAAPAVLTLGGPLWQRVRGGQVDDAA